MNYPGRLIEGRRRKLSPIPPLAYYAVICHGVVSLKYFSGIAPEPTLAASGAKPVSCHTDRYLLFPIPEGAISVKGIVVSIEEVVTPIPDIVIPIRESVVVPIVSVVVVVAVCILIVVLGHSVFSYCVSG